MLTNQRIFHIVEMERSYQIARHGDDLKENRTPVEMVTILAAEVGELAAAAKDAHWGQPGRRAYGVECLCDEAIQVMAVALAIIQQYGGQWSTKHWRGYLIDEEDEHVT